MAHHGPGVIHTPIDYKGRKYSGPYWVDTNPGCAPGWFIWGRSLEEYAPRGIICRVARPDTAPRMRPNWNGRLSAGWRTKREATVVCERFNQSIESLTPCHK